MAPNLNTPQGVENVNTIYAGMPKSEDWGSNRSVKLSKILSMFKALYKLRILILYYFIAGERGNACRLFLWLCERISNDVWGHSSAHVLFIGRIQDVEATES